MPKCKNDESRNYKGDEPSPKGLGYCAHAEPEGSQKKGKDGNMWEVKTVSSGSKRWMKINKITGDKYLVHHNYSRPFMVVINGNNVKIYKPVDQMSDDYSKLVKEYKKTQKVFVGKSSVKSETAKRARGHGKKIDGNTILIEVSKGRYCFVGHIVYEFSTKEDIVKYESPVGNNDVPYPIAYGEKYLYFLESEGRYIEKNKFSSENIDILWDEYFGEFSKSKGWVELKKESKKIKSKIISRGEVLL